MTQRKDGTEGDMKEMADNRRVLFAWEMGENFGHLTRDLSIALKLREMGNEVVFVVRDSEIADLLLTPAGFPFLPSPMPLRSLRLAAPSASYSEILVSRGYFDRMILAGLVRGWLHLFEVIRPDVVVIDHAPTALIATRIRGVPAALIGTGFEIPPSTNPLPSIRPWDQINSRQLAAADYAVLQAINHVLRLHQASPMARVCDLFDDSTALLTTLPELDHYGPRPTREYIGPIAAPSRAPHVDWPAVSGTKVFVYLREPFSEFDQLFSTFAELGIRAVCVIPRQAESLRRRFSDPRLSFFSDAVPIEPLLRGADAVVNYGGAGTIVTSLLASVPMLLIPNTVEQHLGSRKVRELGAGIVLKRKSTQGEYAAALKTLLSSANYRHSARTFSLKYPDFSPEASTNRAAAAVAQLAADFKVS